MNGSLQAGEEYLADLVEAIQRCTYFLDGSLGRLKWPLAPEFLESRKMDVYDAIAEHFNTLHAMTPFLYATAWRFVEYCRQVLDVFPKSGDFESVFYRVVRPFSELPNGEA